VPSWKKIIVSGSNAELNQITSSAGINIKTVGSLTNGISFGDGNTGFYETADNDLKFDRAGSNVFQANTSSQLAFGVSSLFRNTTGGFLISTGATTTGANYSFRGDENTGIGRPAADQVSVIAGGVQELIVKANTISGSATSTGSFGHLELANRDTDASFEFGRAHVGLIGYSDMAGFSHVDHDSTSNFSLAQSAAGKTIVQAASGQAIAFKIGGADKVNISSAGNLGVGIETATEKLHVVGNVFATGNISGSSTSTGSFGKLLGDGSSLTGIVTDLSSDTTPQLGGNLDLNSNNITGTGNIDILGTITAQNFIVSSSVTSIEYQSLSGSTIFGDSNDDTHEFTGSVSFSGSAYPASTDLHKTLKNTMYDGYPYGLTGFATGSYKNEKYEIGTELIGEATHSHFATYVTTIGLYNNSNELVAIGKTAKPIKNDKDMALSFVVRFDTN